MKIHFAAFSSPKKRRLGHSPVVCCPSAAQLSLGKSRLRVGSSNNSLGACFVLNQTYCPHDISSLAEVLQLYYHYTPRSPLYWLRCDSHYHVPVSAILNVASLPDRTESLSLSAICSRKLAVSVSRELPNLRERHESSQHREHARPKLRELNLAPGKSQAL